MITQTQQADVAIVGAGIVGLAHALAAARRGLRVVVFEQHTHAVGASVQNFGLVWPIGQPAGHLHNRAMRSRAIWLEVCQQAQLWHAPSGSLHLLYHADEEAVALEYLETSAESHALGRTMLTAAEVSAKSPAVRQAGLRSALWSPTEINVDPRQAIRTLPQWLTATYGVQFQFGTAVQAIHAPYLETAAGPWQAAQIIVCSGTHFESLYPALYAASGLQRCKLQMLRTAPQPTGWQLGAALCAGLTLLHYGAFRHCTSLAPLRERLQAELPFYLEEGIHVLLSQTCLGELTIGDHHEYAWSHDPFSRETVDAAILAYLHRFAVLPQPTIAERWVGIYPILRGQSELVLHPAAGVTIVNGLGGAGMTLSFGLAEEIVAAL